jgi:hypothetical protein
MMTDFTPKKKRGRPPKPNNLLNKITTTVNIAIHSVSTSETFLNQSIKQGQPDIFTPLMKVNPKRRRRTTPKKTLEYNLITPIDNKSSIIHHNSKNLDNVSGKTLDNLQYVTNGYGYITPKEEVPISGSRSNVNHPNLYNSENFNNLNFHHSLVSPSSAFRAAGVVEGSNSQDSSINVLGTPGAGGCGSQTNFGLELTAKSKLNSSGDLLLPLQKFKKPHDYKSDNLGTLSSIQHSLTNSISSLNNHQNRYFYNNLNYNHIVNGSANEIGNGNGNENDRVNGEGNFKNLINCRNPIRSHIHNNNENFSRSQPISTHDVNKFNYLINQNGESYLPSTPSSIQRSYSYSHLVQPKSNTISTKTRSNSTSAPKTKSKSISSFSDSDFSLKLLIDDSGKAILSTDCFDIKNLGKVDKVDKIDKDRVVEKLTIPKLTHYNTVIGIETIDDMKLSTISETTNNLPLLPQTPNFNRDYHFNTGFTPNSNLALNLTPLFNSMMHSMMSIQSPKRTYLWNEEFDNNCHNNIGDNLINSTHFIKDDHEDSSDARLALKKLIDVKGKSS